MSGLSKPQTPTWRRILPDLTAGLTGGVASIPDGMTASVIIGVPPVHGLYASAVSPIIGGLTSRTPLLIITTTSASALATFEIVRSFPSEQRVAAMLLVTLLAGAFQVLASALGLSRLTEFVSHSLMTGFLLGIAVLIILGQLGTLAGYEAQGDNAISKAFDLITHFSSIDVVTLALGGLTIVLLISLARFGLSGVGPLLALAIPTAIAVGAGLSQVEQVKDVGAIPSTLPSFSVPDFTLLSFDLVTGALAVAAIISIQTAGVSQALPAPKRMNGSQARDLAAAGLANTGSALFGGQTVGGSLDQSAINVRAGATSRLAAIACGIWVLIGILVFAPIVEQIVMTALAALLIVSAFGAIDAKESLTVWRTNWISRVTIALTFGLTLVTPIQVAVAGGMILSAVLYILSAAADVKVVELVTEDGGRLSEHDPPSLLQSGHVTTLQVYGSLFYAGARTLARRLPLVGDSHRAVVILRLRGKTRAGATAIDVLSDYASELKDHEGRLYIAGLSEELRRQLKRGGQLKLAGVQLFRASRIQGRSVARSQRAAQAWLVRTR